MVRTKCYDLLQRQRRYRKLFFDNNEPVMDVWALKKMRFVGMHQNDS